MALIYCPKCNQQISDSTKKCPHCSYALKKEQKKQERQEPVICPECSTSVARSNISCPNCGYLLGTKMERIVKFLSNFFAKTRNRVLTGVTGFAVVVFILIISLLSNLTAFDRYNKFLEKDYKTLPSNVSTKEYPNYYYEAIFDKKIKIAGLTGDVSANYCLTDKYEDEGKMEGEVYQISWKPDFTMTDKRHEKIKDALTKKYGSYDKMKNYDGDEDENGGFKSGEKATLYIWEDVKGIEVGIYVLETDEKYETYMVYWVKAK